VPAAKPGAAVPGRAVPAAKPGAPDAGAVPADGGGATAGRLHVVSTPIGNLGDVTVRALEVLRTVPLVAAEDTRLTRRLFARYAIGTPLVSYHERNAAGREPELLAHLRAGRDLALVTDAGTPLVSDPGAGLVASWAAEGGEVVAVPGASAVLAAVAVSAVAGPRWSFEGFLPRKGRDRRERIARIAADPRATVVYEAPGRLAATLRDLAEACGPGRPAAVCRELTKIHETVTRGTLAVLRDLAADGSIPARGEMAVVVGEVPARAIDDRVPAGAGGRRPAAAGSVTGDDTEAEAAARGSSPADETGAGAPGEGSAVDEARAEVERLIVAGASRGDAAREVSRRTGIPRRALYGAPNARLVP
jgi:16S rRNA (cytidine1402-2'-O)-methyltransferase